MTFADTSEVVWVQPNNVDSYPTNIFPQINLSSSPTAVLLIRENQRNYYQNQKLKDKIYSDPSQDSPVKYCHR